MNLFYPIVIKQQLLFFENNQLKVLYESVSKKIHQNTCTGINIEMLDNVITDIGVIPAKNQHVFMVFGYGGCNACTEYFGYFHLNGTRIWEYYGSRGVAISEYGQKEDLKKLGITDSLSPENGRIIPVYDFTSYP